MINRLKMIKLVRLRCVVRWITKVSLRLARNFGKPDATCSRGQPLTIRILWSALSNFELRSALVNIGSLVRLLKVQDKFSVE